MIGTLRLLLARRKLLAEVWVVTDLDFDAADRAALAANGAALGLDRVSTTTRLVVDGALRGVYWYELANYKLPASLRWATWPLVAVVTVVIAAKAAAHLGAEGLWLLLIFPLWLVALAAAGVAYTFGELRVGYSTAGRLALAAFCGGLSITVFPALGLAALYPPRAVLLLAGGFGIGAIVGLWSRQ